MRLLLVTEKFDARPDQRDGGARLVASLVRAFRGQIDVLQFDAAQTEGGSDRRWRRHYPAQHPNRFERRILNAEFVAHHVRGLAARYTHVLFVHVSMQFGFADAPLRGPKTWTLPMFLTPSYEASGESVPAAYTKLEHRALAGTRRVLSPSHMEKRQLIDVYGVPESQIRVVPRGVDLRGLSPRVRNADGPLRLVSIGSIKPQKNTVELVNVLARLRTRHPDARLRVIGPVQDEPYAAQVRATAARLGVHDAIEFTGFVPPSQLGSALHDSHLHVSTSSCETFGRAIFETLAAGLPGVAFRENNAAYEFLGEREAARFVDGAQEAVEAISELLDGYKARSASATQVGEDFDDTLLAQTLAAEICEATAMAVSDFDGTLFHKGDEERTDRCFEAFSTYPVRVVCSARPVPELHQTMRSRGTPADFYIGWSGAVLADADGRTIQRWPLDAQGLPATLVRDAERIVDGGELLQLALGARSPRTLPAGVRAERYQGHTFLSSRGATKLRAAQALLRHLQWTGRVRAFGDGPHDVELLTWFDGTRVRATRDRAPWLRHALEVTHAEH